MKPLSKPTILIVRHGATAMNVDNELRGWDDPELTGEGHEQAAKAAKKIIELDAPLHHIYTGALRRSRQTGQHVSDATGVNMTHTDALNPWDYGDITGKPEDRQQRKNLKFFQDRPQLKTPGGESYGEFLERYGAALKKAKQYVHEFPGKAVVLVTHSRNLYPTPHLLDGKSDIPTKSDKYGPGTVHKFEFNPDGSYTKTKL